MEEAPSQSFGKSGMDDGRFCHDEDILAHYIQDVVLIFAGRGAPFFNGLVGFFLRKRDSVAFLGIPQISLGFDGPREFRATKLEQNRIIFVPQSH